MFPLSMGELVEQHLDVDRLDNPGGGRLEVVQIDVTEHILVGSALDTCREDDAPVFLGRFTRYYNNPERYDDGSAFALLDKPCGLTPISPSRCMSSSYRKESACVFW